MSPDELKGVLSGSDSETIAVVCLTHVNYQTGEMYDMAATTRMVHDAGALMIWDLAHSAVSAQRMMTADSAMSSLDTR